MIKVINQKEGIYSVKIGTLEHVIVAKIATKLGLSKEEVIAVILMRGMNSLREQFQNCKT